MDQQIQREPELQTAFQKAQDPRRAVSVMGEVARRLADYAEELERRALYAQHAHNS